MVKRSPGAFGRTLGKSTGWILRQELKDLEGPPDRRSPLPQDRRATACTSRLPDRNEVLPFDTIVVCAGQESDRRIADDIAANGQSVHVIGGARLAGELDAKRAIYEGAILGNRI